MPSFERITPAQPEKKKISRRSFLKGAVAAGAVGTVAIIEGPGLIKKTGEHLERFELERFRENIEKEKEAVKRDVAEGLQNQIESASIRTKYNSIVLKSRDFSQDSQEYKDLVKEANALGNKFDGMRVMRGNEVYGLLSEANEAAHALLANDVAIGKLAMTRVLFTEVASDFPIKEEFSYWHNLAPLYLELGSVKPERIQERFKALSAYAEKKKIRASRIPQEQITYSLVDPGFDFELTHAAVEAKLQEQFPTWKKYPATHLNKDSYAHYNDLSVLDIFELNRLHAVLKQLEDRSFVVSVFSARDSDLRQSFTEVGGVIPRPDQSEKLEVLAAPKQFTNDAYRTPDSLAIKAFGSAAQFHFHATQPKEPADVHGPSGGDGAFFHPGVVFTSVDKNTILTHYYVSRLGSSVYDVKNEVVCLGEIKKK